MEQAVILRIMVLLIGALMSGYLVYLFLYKHVMPLLVLVGVSLLAWFGGQFLLTGIQSVFGSVPVSLREGLFIIACGGMLLDAPFLLHEMVRYVRDYLDVKPPAWIVPAIYVPCLVPPVSLFFIDWSSVSSLLTHHVAAGTFYGVKFIHVLSISVVSWWFSARTQHRDLRYFSRRFPLFLLASPAISLGVFLYTGGQNSTALMTLSYGSPLLPMLFFLWTVHRYQLLSVEITERTVFAFSAILTLFLYFYIIRHIGSRLETYYDINPEALEIVLFLMVIILLTITGQWAMKLLESRPRRNSYRVLDALSDHLSSADINRNQGIKLISEKLQEAFEASVETVRDQTDPLFDHVPEHPEQPMTVLDRHRERLIETLRDRNGRMLVPLSDEDEVLALIILGPRRHYLSYTPGEQEAVSLVMKQFREAVKNHDLIQDRLSLERTIQQEKKLEALGNVAASCAHEVKNPLSSINGIVTNLKEELEDNDQHRRDVEVIKDEIDRLRSVVQQILSFARKGADQTKDIDVVELVNGVTYVLGKSPEGIRIETKLPDEPMYVRAVESDLKGILFNLLRNAIEASPRGEEVTVEVAPEGQRIIIKMTNPGDGPDNEVLEQLREQTSIEAVRQRDGFGLSIVLDQLKEMNGFLDIDSDGETTTVTVRFPRVSDDDAGD